MNIRLKGHVVLEARNTQGRLVARRECRNLWLSSGKNFAANIIAATAGYSVGLVHCALGVGVTTPAVGDIILVNEVTRKAVTSRTVTNNILVVSTFFTAAESTYSIQEIGIFGHTDSTTVANTGKLFARALLAFDNVTSPVNLTITWSLTFG